MSKLKVTLPSIILFLVVAFAITFYYRFMFLTNRQADKFINEEFINKRISGHLTKIVKYSKNKVVLEIENFDNQMLTFGTLCVDNKFLYKVALKDSVYKSIGEQELNFITRQKERIILKVIFCE